MKARRVTVDGNINSLGQVRTTQLDKLNNFGSKWPNEAVVIEVRVLPKSQSQRLLGRYWMKVVPEFARAYKETMNHSLTYRQMDLELRKMSAIPLEEITTEDGIVAERVRGTEELSSHEMVEYMKELEVIGSTEFNIIL